MDECPYLPHVVVVFSTMDPCRFGLAQLRSGTHPVASSVCSTDNLAALIIGLIDTVDLGGGYSEW
jgi:hypothetical protein